MWFYGCLKGLSEAEVKSELDTLLDNVGLLHKRHEQTKNLSGKVHLFYKNAVSLSTFYIFYIIYSFVCLVQVACRGSCRWQ